MSRDGALLSVLLLTSVLIVYHHVGYPLLLTHFAARRRAKGTDPQVVSTPSPTTDLPSLALLVPAHNEAGFIAGKIENIAGLAYPPDRLEVVLAFDGCTDRTVALAHAALEEEQIVGRVSIVEFPERIGKVAVLNHCIARVQQQIVALSDTSAQISPDALLRAGAHFLTPDVGVVCGTYELNSPLNEGERAYWRYQTSVKRDEAALAAPMGAHGALYFIRRCAWRPLEPDTINDDFMLPMRIVASGYRAIYDARIRALELERTTPEQELRRRVRIGAGNMQQCARLPELMNPRRGWLAFVWLSGKGLRPLIPFLGLAGLASLALLAWDGYRWAGGLVVAALALIAGALLAPKWLLERLPAPLVWLHYFIEGHAASLLGALQYFAGKWRSPTRNVTPGAAG